MPLETSVLDEISIFFSPKIINSWSSKEDLKFDITVPVPPVEGGTWHEIQRIFNVMS